MTKMRQAIDISSQLYLIRDQQIFLNGESGFVRLFNEMRGLTAS